MRRVQTSEFPALSIYYTSTELGAGPQRNESCAAISATCNETRDWLAWTIGLCYLVVSCPDPFRKIEKGSGHELAILHAVVSICEYTVSNKGGVPCHCLGDCVGAIVSDQTLEKSKRRVWHIGRGGSVHCGMLEILLLNLAKSVKFSAELDTSTNGLSFLLAVYSLLQQSKMQKRFSCG